MSYDWAFLPMAPSSALLDDPGALRARFEEDGYLYLDGLLPADAVTDVRRDIVDVLADVGWIKNTDPMLARAAIAALPDWHPDYPAGMDAVQKVESFHALAHHPALLGAMQTLLGPTAFPHPLKIARLVFPDCSSLSTPPHQDFPNNQGSTELTAAWVPLGDIDDGLGGLAFLRGSHKWGLLPMALHVGSGNRCAVLPPEMLEQCRWVSIHPRAGDVLVFSSLCVHTARHNETHNRFRLSVDFRYQREGDALTEGCLEPHFQRLGWEDVYADWKSEEFQYYWRNLDYEIVPFKDFEVSTEEVDKHLRTKLLAQRVRQSRLAQKADEL